MAAVPSSLPPQLGRQPSTSHELRAVFRSLDADDDGVLSAREMRMAMTTLDIECDVAELFTSVGVSGEGIDYATFVRLVEAQGDVLHLADAEPSLVDLAVRKFRHEVGRHVNLLKQKPEDVIGSTFRPESIVSTAERTVVFTGHQKADMDSIGAAIGASYLYSTSGCASLAAVTGTPEKGGGRATTNTESRFALLFWGDLLARDTELGSDVRTAWVVSDATQFYTSFDDERDELHKGFCGFDVARDVLREPPTFVARAAAIAAQRNQQLGVCLLDHNQKTQMPVSLDPAWSHAGASAAEKAAHVGAVMNRVVGIIDHHALQQKTVETACAVFTDIRPWGSCCTILVYHFLSQGVAIPQGVAGILLSAILSDTLNFKSPTATPYDERAVAILASIALPHRGVADLNKLCGMQFKAKCFVVDGSAHEIINGDTKHFTVANPSPAAGGETSFSWGTAEVFPSGAALGCTERGACKCGDVFGHAWARRDELMYELRAKAKEDGAARGSAEHLGFFSLVDGTLSYDTALFCAGEREKLLAERAFGDDAFVTKVRSSFLFVCATLVQLCLLICSFVCLRTYNPIGDERGLEVRSGGGRL